MRPGGSCARRRPSAFGRPRTKRSERFRARRAARLDSALPCGKRPSFRGMVDSWPLIESGSSRSSTFGEPLSCIARRLISSLPSLDGTVRARKMPMLRVSSTVQGVSVVAVAGYSPGSSVGFALRWAIQALTPSR